MKKLKIITCSVAILATMSTILLTQTKVQATEISNTDNIKSYCKTSLSSKAKSGDIAPWANNFPFLSRGDRGATVKHLQIALKRGGYYSGTCDGIFGSGTENAVKAFQRHVGLNADGMLGPRTWTRINYLWLNEDCSDNAWCIG